MTQTKNPIVECPYCKKKYHENSIHNHTRNAHPEHLDEECPTCGKLFDSVTGMRSHHARTHGESLLQTDCEYCGETFKANEEGNSYCSMRCETLDGI